MSVEHVRSGDRSPPAKRMRDGDVKAPCLAQTQRLDDASDRIQGTDFMSPAMKVIDAIKSVKHSHAIGYCPAKLDAIKRYLLREGRLESDIEYSDGEKGRDREQEAHNADIVAKISSIYEEFDGNYASGDFSEPFRLQITRLGCEFDGSIVPPTKVQQEHEVIEARLKRWYDGADVSGYGDVRQQVTKVDEAVRCAREIPATEFTVEPEMLSRIADIWDKNFYTNSNVRVDPYKIHLYGPGSHFKAHRDTPQKDLVGTFLVGLGDTVDDRTCGLFVCRDRMPATDAHWCAFYPDVPHQVKKITSGYRAVIAFKIFRDAAATQVSTTYSKVRDEVRHLVGQMEPPFGLLLERKYSLGTTEFSGFDALVRQATCTQLNAEVRHLPVVLESSSTYETCWTAVTAFTRGHIEVIAAHRGYEGSDYHAACGAPWLTGVEDVPFFSYDFHESVYEFSNVEQEDIEYTGNESQEWREDSVYLSYALLVLPKKAL